MNKSLILATRNKDKIFEISRILKGFDINLLTPDDFENVPEVVEDRPTLEENAIKKAKEVSEHAGFPAVADDTGLEVDFLNGAPGVYSSRFAGEGATYAENVHKLLRELQGVAWVNRRARFRCVVAFYENDTVELTEGRCEGFICREPRGDRGFGYDPIFFLPEYQKTFAEMDLKFKNRISHRGKAFKAFREMIDRKWCN